jgi:hypothetical protein
MLHLCLRVVDKLFELFFDSYIGNSTSLDHRPHIKKFLTDLMIKCGITKVLDFGKSNTFNIKSLMGPEIVKIFENLNIEDYVYDHEKKRKNRYYLV